MPRKRRRPFQFRTPDPTAEGGVATIDIDPTFDRIPSTGELVDDDEKAARYVSEVCK